MQPWGLKAGSCCGFSRALFPLYEAGSEGDGALNPQIVSPDGPH